MAQGVPRRGDRHDGLLTYWRSNRCHDHFKQVDDRAVMGIMNGKGVIDVQDGVGRYFYFFLERV